MSDISEIDNPWRPIESAPRSSRHVEVKLADGTIHRKAHWASDLSGEEQPPFEGWFIESGEYACVEIPEPVQWRPIV